MARYDYIQNNNRFLANMFGVVGLHKYCLEIQRQAEQRKRNMMSAIRKNPANRVTERDKAKNPITWVQRMNQFQSQIHEVINADLILS